ncbi:hypothetical protein [Massilia sp. TWR1-2-2]|uniref:hypothetical protein n=1 Tax=Massilia sp. TWR1-2-2 TaxID=2804584 RepID=UPI003CEE9057
MDPSGATVTSVDTSATTGASNITINAANTTFVGGAGADTVNLSTTTTTKAISLGAGVDVLRLASGTTSLSANMDGGAGSDLLRMDVADAAVASATSSFAGKIDSFEKMFLNAGLSGSTSTVDLSNLDNISFVISVGTGPGVAAAAPTAAVTAGVNGVSAEATTFTFGAGFTLPGQAFTIDGVTVSAGPAGTFTADEIAAVFRGGTVAGLAKVGTFATPSGWLGTPVASGATNPLVLTNTVNGNVTDFTTASAGGANGTAALIVNKMADGGTMELTNGPSGSTTVNMTDATGTADMLNVNTRVASTSLDFGTVTAAGVETINLNLLDSVPTVNGLASIQTATLNLVDASLKSLIITGNSNLVLSQSAAALTMTDASAMSGIPIAATNGTVSQTIKGGSAADVLTATGNAHVLVGGAGADRLVVGTTADLTTLPVMLVTTRSTCRVRPPTSTATPRSPI